MNKKLFITQREKEVGEGAGLVTQLRKLNFYFILSEIKPEEAHFPGKLCLGGRNRRAQGTQLVSYGSSYLKEAIKHEH